jgi:cytochrome b
MTVAGDARAGGAPRRVKVWPLALRLFHWSFATSMIVAFATHENVGTVHYWAGYAAIALAAVRGLLGIAGPPVWRFGGFVTGPAATLRYAQALLRRTEPRFLGHNPLGGWMVLALLADALVTGTSGWLYTTDRFFGVEWVGALHEVSGEALPLLLLAHVAGVIFTSIRHRENLAGAMVHGFKRTEVVPDQSANTTK